MPSTIIEILEESARKYGKNIAFQMKSNGGYRKITYEEALKLVRSLSFELIALGVKKGDRIALLSENRPEWGIAYFAIVNIGTIVVPLDTRLKEEEISNLLEDSGAAVVITSNEFFPQLPKLSQIKKIILMDEFKSINQEASKVDINPEDVASIVYTSGTTGKPKGVMLTHKNITSNVVALSGVIEASEKDNLLSILPLSHTFETTVGFLTPIYFGARITYAESLKSEKLLKNMQETGVTIIIGVPLFYQLLYEGLCRRLPKILRKYLVRKIFGGKIRFFSSGGAYLNPEIIWGFKSMGITILQGYGLTESSPVISLNTLGKNKIGSIGLPLPEIEVKIFQPKADPPLAENAGEILARGPNIMKGYYKNPEATAQILKDGWLYTGDLGYIDKDGYLFISGRSKDVIVTPAGVNVYPDEVEEKLLRSKAIAEVCVVGKIIKSGPRKGMEEVHAVVLPNFEYLKTSDDAKIKEIIGEEIQKYGKEVAEYKRIASFSIRREEFPKTALRKIKRFEIRREINAD